MGIAEILSKGTEWMDFIGLCNESVNRNKDLPGGENAAGHFFFCLPDKFPSSQKNRYGNRLIA